jgi:hypothetical protein
MSDKNKYPGYNKDDTFWDEHNKKNGLMTNSEFFTSNGPGGFYEGMEYNEESGGWVTNQETRDRETRKLEANKCPDCGDQKPYCSCE